MFLELSLQLIYTLLIKCHRINLFDFFLLSLLSHTHKSIIKLTVTYGFVVWWLKIKLDEVVPLIADPPLLKFHQ